MSTLHHVAYTSQEISNRDKWLHDKVFGISSQKLDWNDKGVVFGISQEFVRLGARHTQLTKIWYGNVQDFSQLSTDTVKKSVSKLVKAKGLIREQRWVEDARTKEKKKRTYLAFTPEFIINPALLFTDMPDSNWGGNRTTIRRHKNCGGEVVNLCTTCGQTHVPDSEIYLQYVDDLSTSPNNTQALQLQQLDAIATSFNPTVDAHDIPDYLYNIHGEAVFNMPLPELQEKMKFTHEEYLEEYEGVSPEDLDEAARQIREMNDKYKGGF